MKKNVSVEQAVGMVLPHDITEIIKDEFKGRAFKKGDVLRKEDIEHLKRLGKDHIYILELGDDEIHENEAARLLAAAFAGPGTTYSQEVVEGKIAIKAACDGLLKINKATLLECNMLGEVMCATLHDNTPVRKGEQVAATRLIPLITERQLVDKAVRIAGAGEKMIRVLPLRSVRAGLVITGNEIFYGRIEDRFEEVLRAKLKQFGSEVAAVRFAPDDSARIADEIRA